MWAAGAGGRVLPDAKQGHSSTASSGVERHGSATGLREAAFSVHHPVAPCVVCFISVLDLSFAVCSATSATAEIFLLSFHSQHKLSGCHVPRRYDVFIFAS